MSYKEIFVSIDKIQRLCLYLRDINFGTLQFQTLNKTIISLIDQTYLRLFSKALAGETTSDQEDALVLFRTYLCLRKKEYKKNEALLQSEGLALKNELDSLSVSLLISQAKNLKETLHNFPQIITELNKMLDVVDEDKLKSFILQLFRKNMSFIISPAQFGEGISGKIAVTIRHLLVVKEEHLSLVVAHLGEALHRYGSWAQYYRAVESYVRRVLEHALIQSHALFTRVYGKKITFVLFFDIEADLSSAEAYVFSKNDQKLHAYVPAKVSVDPTNKTIEVNVPLTTFITHLMDEATSASFAQVMVHEFGHIFDKFLVSKAQTEDGLSKIRCEGIARLTETTFTKAKFAFNVTTMIKMMECPIDSYEMWERIDGDSAKHYEVGEFVCFVFLLYMLKQKFPEVGTDIFTDAGVKEVYSFVHTNPLAEEIAKNTLSILRGLTDAQFFTFYAKYSHILGIPLIFTEEVLQEIQKKK